jgi:hypothetical protein
MQQSVVTFEHFPIGGYGVVLHPFRDPQQYTKTLESLMKTADYAEVWEFENDQPRQMNIDIINTELLSKHVASKHTACFKLMMMDLDMQTGKSDVYDEPLEKTGDLAVMRKMTRRGMSIADYESMTPYMGIPLHGRHVCGVSIILRDHVYIRINSIDRKLKRLNLIPMRYFKHDGSNLKEEHIMPLIRQLNELHKHGIFHRDIKKDNIMLAEIDGQRHARFIDFGNAYISNCEHGDFKHMVNRYPHPVVHEMLAGEKYSEYRAKSIFAGAVALHFKKHFLDERTRQYLGHVEDPNVLRYLLRKNDCFALAAVITTDILGISQNTDLRGGGLSCFGRRSCATKSPTTTVRVQSARNQQPATEFRAFLTTLFSRSDVFPTPHPEIAPLLFMDKNDAMEFGVDCDGAADTLISSQFRTPQQQA